MWKKFIEYLKNPNRLGWVILAWWVQSWRTIALYFAALVVIGLLYSIFLYTANNFGILSLLPYGVIKAFVGALTLRLIDQLMLYEIGTLKTLRSNPIAYAIYILAFAIVVAAGLFSA